MTAIEKIKAEIERLKTVQFKRIQEGDLVDAEPYDKIEAYNELLDFLTNLESEKPMNQDELEKAVVDYFEGYWPGMETAEQCNTDLRFTPPAIMRLARHFAKWGAGWQEKQMMKEAVEGEITKDNRGNNVLRVGLLNNGFEVGDKVRIIIVKED